MSRALCGDGKDSVKRQMQHPVILAEEIRGGWDLSSAVLLLASCCPLLGLFCFAFGSLKQYKCIKMQRAFHLGVGFVCAVKPRAPSAGDRQLPARVSCPHRELVSNGDTQTGLSPFLLCSPYLQFLYVFCTFAKAGREQIPFVLWEAEGW